MKNERRMEVGIMLMVILIISLPLMGNVIYTLPYHDHLFHLQRIISIKNGLADGQFPVRIYSEIFNGYGYGASLFYPELFLYIPAIFVLAGLPLVMSYSIFLILINAATLLCAFLSFSTIAKSRHIGLVSAVLYEMSVYRMVDLYTRGSMGEYLALLFCPIALCGLVLLKRGEKKKWWVLAAAFCGLLQSHILTFVIMTIVAVIFVLVNFRTFIQIDRIMAVIKAAVTTVVLNLWFLIPFLQVSKMNVEAMSGTEAFWMTKASLSQIFDLMLLNPGGHEMLLEGPAQSMPKTAGMPILIGCIFLIFLFLERNKKDLDQIPRYVYFYLLAGLISIGMMTNFFPWNLFMKISALKGFLEKFQFIWRLNVLVILFLSLAAGYGYYIFFSQNKNKMRVVMTISAAVCVYSLVFMNGFVNVAEMRGNDEAVGAAYMDTLYLTQGNRISDREDLESNVPDIIYTNVVRGNAKISFQYHLEGEALNGSYVDVPITYYPGYNAFVDGKEAKTKCSDAGVVQVILPDGSKDGNVTVAYSESGLYKLGNLVSLAGLCAIIALLIRSKVSQNLNAKRRKISRNM